MNMQRFITRMMARQLMYHHRRGMGRRVHVQQRVNYIVQQSRQPSAGAYSTGITWGRGFRNLLHKLEELI